MQRGPQAYVLVRNPGTFNFGKVLTLWFLYIILISIFVAYLTGLACAAGTPYIEVFRVAGAAAVLAYAFRTVPEAIWYGKPWKVVIKEMIDGIFTACYGRRLRLAVAALISGAKIPAAHDNRQRERAGKCREVQQPDGEGSAARARRDATSQRASRSRWRSW